MLDSFKSACHVLAGKAAVRAHRYMYAHGTLRDIRRQFLLAKNPPSIAVAGWAPHLCVYESESGDVLAACSRCGRLRSRRLSHTAPASVDSPND